MSADKLETAASVIKSVCPVKYRNGSLWSLRDSSVIFLLASFSCQWQFSWVSLAVLLTTLSLHLVKECSTPLSRFNWKSLRTHLCHVGGGVWGLGLGGWSGSNVFHFPRRPKGIWSWLLNYRSRTKETVTQIVMVLLKTRLLNAVLCHNISVTIRTIQYWVPPGNRKMLRTNRNSYQPTNY